MLSCRGLGKCVVKEVLGQSKKGRIMLILERYIVKQHRTNALRCFVRKFCARFCCDFLQYIQYCRKIAPHPDKNLLANHSCRIVWSRHKKSCCLRQQDFFYSSSSMGTICSRLPVWGCKVSRCPSGADVEPGGSPAAAARPLVFPQAQGGLLAAGIEGSQDGLPPPPWVRVKASKDPFCPPGSGYLPGAGRGSAWCTCLWGGRIQPISLRLPAPGEVRRLKGSSKPSIPASSP